jgi:succinate-semialdehyde dehydrogenase/glutarate-semialdehyde dehydrogenase
VGISLTDKSLLKTDAYINGQWIVAGQDREGSNYGLDDYMEIKYMCLGGIDQ